MARQVSAIKDYGTVVRGSLTRATIAIGEVSVESAVRLTPDSPWTAWTAALLEGEGCFSRSPARITINMCDRDVLEKVLVCTGVGSITGPHARMKAHHRPVWRWRVSRAADCWVLCQLVLPWLGIRRKVEALLLCESFKTMTAGRVLHGTRAYYKRGCRCDACRRANHHYVTTQAESRRRARADPVEGSE